VQTWGHGWLMYIICRFPLFRDPCHSTAVAKDSGERIVSRKKTEKTNQNMRNRFLNPATVFASGRCALGVAKI